jgi:hypothetical protein
VLPLIVVVEISLQLHQSYYCILQPMYQNPFRRYYCIFTYVLYSSKFCCKDCFIAFYDLFCNPFQMYYCIFETQP